MYNAREVFIRRDDYLSDRYSENTMLMIAHGENAMIVEQCESPLTVKDIYGIVIASIACRIHRSAGYRISPFTDSTGDKIIPYL